jgi:hypothetical protein
MLIQLLFSACPDLRRFKMVIDDNINVSANIVKYAAVICKKHVRWEIAKRWNSLNARVCAVNLREPEN